MWLYKNKRYKFNEPIDLVYLWVNSDDEDWKAEMLKWKSLEFGLSSRGGFRDCRFFNNHELKYSIRSVLTNAPWINKIYIVTNGQVPDWLNLDYSKIKIIPHSQILPQDALPTFNSEAIEACICNIPELSEYFLYSNDDMFINRPVTPDYFFDKNGKPIVRLVKQKWTTEERNSNLYLQNIEYSIQLIKTKFGKEYKYEPSHNIDAYRKSYFLECKNEFLEQFKAVYYKKFRTTNSVQRHIVSLYMLAKKYAKLKKVDIRINSKKKELENIYLPIMQQDKMKNAISVHNPVLMCINDDENAVSEDRKNLKIFLSALYPIRHNFEKDDDWQIYPVFDDDNARAIVFAPDKNYFKYFCVALYSLIKNSSPEYKYDIVVINSDASERSKKLIEKMIPENFSLRFVNIQEYINQSLIGFNLKSRMYWSISMYYRIFIPLLMRNYSKVLYCDSDIIFNSSVDELFDVEFENNSLLAVLDEISPVINFDKYRFYHFKNVLKLNEPQCYFNSGILMFNIKQISVNSYLEDVKNTLNIPSLMYPDQDILNMLFQNQVKYVSWRWNFQWHVPIFRKKDFNLFEGKFKDDYWKSYANPSIIHYTSSVKPWNSPEEEFAEEFWKYARQTPFYEEIIFANMKSPNIADKRIISNIISRRKIFFNYYRCKLLSCITFGSTKKHYKSKRTKLKEKVKSIRQYLNVK